MTCRFEGLTVDCADPRTLAAFWCAVLGYTVGEDRDGELVEIGPSEPSDLAELRTRPLAPEILFVRVPEARSGKNRLHLDVCPIDGGQAEELRRILALGARHADIGQGEGRSWYVLADPEGNEFCLVRSLAEGHFVDQPPHDQQPDDQPRRSESPEAT